jgi:hypothetical protein
MYRQLTLAAMGRANAAGIESPDFLGLGYQDVRAAWRYYLAHDNGNRGIVLIGHSQGTSILTELIRREIDGTPVQSRIVSTLCRRTGHPRAARARRRRHVCACRSVALARRPAVSWRIHHFVTAPPTATTLRSVGRLDTRRGVHQSCSARRRQAAQRLFRRREELPCRSGPQIRGPLADDPL